MSFLQNPPRLGNQYDDDPLLDEYLTRVLPAEVLAETRPELRELGEQSGGVLYERQLADLAHEPTLVSWDPWGRRVDRTELTAVWQQARRIAAEHGLVAAAYEERYGELARVYQFAMNYLVQPSLDVYSCPLAMTDGAARTLLALGNQELVRRAVPRLSSRAADLMWTSGQWMTERTGGSDVGLSETVARRVGDGWQLFGDKWFTSAVTCDMALTLARPEGNGPGGRGLALFYLELARPDGSSNGIRVHRLKNKLGTKKLPTAELSLEGTWAIPVSGLSDGVKNITPMLNVTRMWNAVASVWGMRRALALAQDYAQKRVQFRSKLSDKPLHADTLAGIAAELEAAFHLAFRTVELAGKVERGSASELERELHRAMTPIVKLTTAKQAVAVASEALECFGGAGYVEDTGLPRLLADAQVLPIWEGTTNVLSLDLLRAMAKGDAHRALRAEAESLLGQVTRSELRPCVEAARAALERAGRWFLDASSEPERLEAGARRFALTVGRSLELALLARHAEWCLEHGRGLRALAAANRFRIHGIDQIREVPLPESRSLAVPER